MAGADLAPRTRGFLGTALQVVTLVLLLAILASVIVGLLAIVSLVNAPHQAAGDVAAQAGQALGSAQQAIQNATDPNHPPVGLAYDTEFTALDVWHVGDGLPGGSDYLVTIRGVQRRDGASSPDTGMYAVLHAELRQPRVTRIFGQAVRSDSDPHEYAVYKGEAFRLSGMVYRVNWISQDENAMGAGVVRNPDSMTQSIKFDYP